MSLDDKNDQHEEPSQQLEPTTATAAATTRPRRRAASRPAGPPRVIDESASASPDQPVIDPAGPADHAEVEESVEQTPEAAPRKRRVVKRKAVAEPSEPAATVMSAAAPEAVEEAPARAVTRSRSRRKAVATAEPTAVVDEAPVSVADPNEPALDLEGDVVQEIEPSASSAVQVAETKASKGAAAPLFQPLFQAPSAVTVARSDDTEGVAPARRRRSASRPVGPPVSEPELEEPEVVVEAGESDPEAVDREGDEGEEGPRRRRRRGGRSRRRSASENETIEDETEVAEQGDAAEEGDDSGEEEDAEGSTSSRRRRRRRRRGSADTVVEDDPPGTVTRVRDSRRASTSDVSGVKGSTRLEAKKQRRREGREAGRRRSVVTEAEFLARRESVERVMAVRERDGRTQIGVLEDGVLVEHYIARRTQTSMVGNVYLGRVQNVLPSMEAAFVDLGRGRNAVLYAGEVNWDAAGLEGQPKRIEHALKSGESVLVQVTKDPIGHKGARLTSQVSLPGRYLVYVPDGSMTGISRKLPDTERTRLKKVLRDVVPDGAGVIVRTAAEGASEDELRSDVARLAAQWEDISAKAGAVNAPALLYGEPDLAIRVVRDIFNEDFASMIVDGADAWETLESYISHVAPDLAERMHKWEPVEGGPQELFASYRIDEQLHKALDRKVWLPSGGSLVIDRTEAMTVVDVNTGRFTGSGGNLEETVTKNNLEAAEEIVRQLRLRDIGGIIVVDFIDMVLESNRDLVLRRLLECLGRDRTKHQVAEVTSLGLVQMTRKRVGQGLLEVFSENCEACNGRGVIVHDEPVEKESTPERSAAASSTRAGSGRGRGRGRSGGEDKAAPPEDTTSAEADPTPPAGESTEQAAAEAKVSDDVPPQPNQPNEPSEPSEPAGDAVVDKPAKSGRGGRGRGRRSKKDKDVDQNVSDNAEAAVTSGEPAAGTGEASD